MSRNRSLNDPVVAWLKDQPLAEIPEHVVRAIVDETRRTGQQRTVFGWRPKPMYRTFSIVATGAVAIVVAVAGAVLLGTGGSNTPSGAQQGSPTPSGSPSETVSPLSDLPGRFAFAADRTGNVEIYSMRPDGTELVQLTDDPAEDREAAWSPDGSMLAFTRFDPAGSAVWVMNGDGSEPRRLADGGSPQWSFDGQRIVAQDGGTIFAIDADGTGRVDIIDEPTSGLLLSAPSWLADGSGIVFIGSPGEGLGSDIYQLRLDGTGLTQLTTSRDEEASPRVSPDGRSIAFVRDFKCVCTMAADGSNERLLEDRTGKGVPLSWSPDGTWIARAGGSHGALFIRVINATSGEDVVASETGDYFDISWGP